ncbi:hypothetical protein [Propionivibrio sp.]|uniref:hypothetical protein n=1 Tax=Propionivibrio sp. TaxID=2212460 RepID=UPI0025E92686|nr:hypothetical protein [Propionivibrio sp.]
MRTPLCGALLGVVVMAGADGGRARSLDFGTTGAREGVPRGFCCGWFFTGGDVLIVSSLAAPRLMLGLPPRTGLRPVPATLASALA